MIFLSWECKCNFYNLDWTVSESEVQQTFIATSSVSFYMFYITLIPCQASCQVCLLTYGGRNLCVNSPSFDDIWQTSPAIHPPRHLVLHLSHVCEINANACFFKDNFSYETAAGQQHLRCRKKILAQNYDPMISHNTQQWTAQCTDFTRHSSIHPNLHFSNNIVGRFDIEVPFLTASNKGVNYARVGHLISASCHAGWWVWNWSQQWWSNFRSKLNVNLIIYDHNALMERKMDSQM